MQNIDVLIFDGCPNIEPTLKRVRAAITAAQREEDAIIRVVRIETDEDAQRERFLGSPSVRVDGVDVEQAARARTDFGLQCRVYSVGERLDGAPPVEWIGSALRGGSQGDDESGGTTTSAHDCCRHGR